MRVRSDCQVDMIGTPDLNLRVNRIEMSSPSGTKYYYTKRGLFYREEIRLSKRYNREERLKEIGI